MLKLAALLAALVFASPATAMNELLGQPISQVEEIAKETGAVLERLNAADTAAMDAGTNPRPKPSTIYLLTIGPSVVLVLVHEGGVIFSSDPIEAAKINKILNRSGV
jgi:hypothetical protein